MMSKDDSELLVRTDPGTPGGDFLRRTWQPVALREELPPGAPPLPVKLLGEELVLFRDETGKPGLLGLHCSHRGAQAHVEGDSGYPGRQRSPHVIRDARRNSFPGLVVISELLSNSTDWKEYTRKVGERP